MMNDYIVLNGKKYKTPAKFWQPYVDKPATLRKTLLGETDVTFGPAVTEEWRGQIEGPIVPIYDIPQIETATAVGTVSGAGDVNVQITADVLAPQGNLAEWDVPVLHLDLASQWAAKVRAAIAGEPLMQTFFTIGGTGAEIVLTRKNAAPNDPTLNIALSPGTALGPVAAPTSANTQAGGTTWGTIDDLRTVISRNLPVPFIDHYGNSCSVVVLGPFAERSLASKWDSPTNVIFLQVRLVKV